MSVGVALAVGLALGLLTMVLVTGWAILRRGTFSRKVPYVVLAVVGVSQFVLATVSGSFKSALVLFTGVVVGMSLSSIVTLPMIVLARKRFTD